MKLRIDKIRVEMAKRNMSQKILAEKANIQRSTLCRIMRNKSIGNTRTWSKIASALEVDVTALIED